MGDAAVCWSGGRECRMLVLLSRLSGSALAVCRVPDGLSRLPGQSVPAVAGCRVVGSDSDVRRIWRLLRSRVGSGSVGSQVGDAFRA